MTKMHGTQNVKVRNGIFQVLASSVFFLKIARKGRQQEDRSFIMLTILINIFRL